MESLKNSLSKIVNSFTKTNEQNYDQETGLKKSIEFDFQFKKEKTSFLIIFFIMFFSSNFYFSYFTSIFLTIVYCLVYGIAFMNLGKAVIETSLPILKLFKSQVLNNQKSAEYILLDI